MNLKEMNEKAEMNQTENVRGAGGVNNNNNNKKTTQYGTKYNMITREAVDRNLL